MTAKSWLRIIFFVLLFISGLVWWVWPKPPQPTVVVTPSGNIVPSKAPKALGNARTGTFRGFIKGGEAARGKRQSMHPSSNRNHAITHSDAHHFWCDEPKCAGPCNCGFVPPLIPSEPMTLDVPDAAPEPPTGLTALPQPSPTPVSVTPIGVTPYAPSVPIYVCCVSSPPVHVPDIGEWAALIFSVLFLAVFVPWRKR